MNVIDTSSPRICMLSYSFLYNHLIFGIYSFSTLDTKSLSHNIQSMVTFRGALAPSSGHSRQLQLPYQDGGVAYNFFHFHFLAEEGCGRVTRCLLGGELTTLSIKLSVMNIRKVVYWSVDEMGKPVLFSLLFLASLRAASTEEKFTKEGGSVTLDLSPAPSDPITIIQWKFEDSILAEWVIDVLNVSLNREHIKLDIFSGRLVMEKMTKAEEGVYSVEINDNKQNVTYSVLVIRDVPKPACSKEECIMTCEGPTTGAGPVTYSWETGDGKWKEHGHVKNMSITKKEHGHVKNFTCKMNNPVSEEVSEPLPNQLSKKEEPAGVIAGSIIVVLLVVAAGIGCFWAWKNDKSPCVKRSTI